MLPSIFGDNLFDDFFRSDFPAFPAFPAWNGREYLCGKNAANWMKTDVRELENTYEVDMELPGFAKEDIHVDLKDGTLTVSAEKNTENSEKNDEGKLIRQERCTGTCSRSFYVGEMRPEDISARYEDGILKLSMPKQVTPVLPESTSIAIG